MLAVISIKLGCFFLIQCAAHLSLYTFNQLLTPFKILCLNSSLLRKDVTVPESLHVAVSAKYLIVQAIIYCQISSVHASEKKKSYHEYLFREICIFRDEECQRHTNIYSTAGITYSCHVCLVGFA